MITAPAASESSLRPDFHARATRLRALLPGEPGGAFVTIQPADIEYLTGLPPSPVCMVLLRDVDKPILLVDEARWNGAVDARPTAELRRFTSVDGLVGALAGLLRERGVRELVTEDLPIGLAHSLADRVGVTVRVVGGLVGGLRREKDSYEQARLRDAARLADACTQVARAAIRPGATELQVAAEIERHIRLAGGEATWFPTVVSSGRRAAHPVYPATRKVIERGDMVVVDVGPKLDGYCADLTRTFIVGPVDPRQVEIYGAVLDAQERAIDAVRAGAMARTVDQAARDLFSERGLAEFTSHPVGHGLGLAKEPPVLAQGSGDVLRVGDCVTVEPGVYIPGFGGVRIEDILLIRDEAVECLSRAPRDLSFAVID